MPLQKETPRPGTGASREKRSCCGERFRDAKSLELLQADIEAAEAYERIFALKQYRVRNLILTLKVKRDALRDLGATLADRRAAA